MPIIRLLALFTRWNIARMSLYDYFRLIQRNDWLMEESSKKLDSTSIPQSMSMKWEEIRADINW